jgi:hypothetical protein
LNFVKIKNFKLYGLYVTYLFSIGWTFIHLLHFAITYGQYNNLEISTKIIWQFFYFFLCLSKIYNYPVLIVETGGRWKFYAKNKYNKKAVVESRIQTIQNMHKMRKKRKPNLWIINVFLYLSLVFVNDLSINNCKIISLKARGGYIFTKRFRVNVPSNRTLNIIQISYIHIFDSKYLSLNTKHLLNKLNKRNFYITFLPDRKGRLLKALDEGS